MVLVAPGADILVYLASAAGMSTSVSGFRVEEMILIESVRSNGWCGNTAEYCGSGVCQSDFGECDIASPTETSVRLSAASEYCEMSTNTDRATAVTLTDLDSSITLVTFDRTRLTQSNLPTSTALHKSFAEGLKQSHPSDADYGSSALSDSAVKPTTFPGSSPSFPADFTPLVLHQPEQPVSNGPPQPTSFQTITSAAYQMNPPPPSAAPGGGDGDSNSGSKTYIRQYTGDGSSSMGWPSEDDWLSFETLWGINQLVMKSSCSSIYSQKNNTEQELSDVKAAILDVSASSGVDKAFILAIMLQESNACVRAPTTTHSHANPGLFQSHKGEGSCDNGHSAQSPCPKSEIYQMVKDGVEGTASGDGLRQLLAKASGDGAQRHYRAARMYNSGSVDPSGNLGLGVSTHCYCSDLANRLTGWSDGISECDAGSVGA